MSFTQNIKSDAQVAEEGGTLTNEQAKYFGGPTPKPGSEKNDINFIQNIEKDGQKARRGGRLTNRQGYHISESGTVLQDQPQIDQSNQGVLRSDNQTGGPIANTPRRYDTEEEESLR